VRVRHLLVAIALTIGPHAYCENPTHPKASELSAALRPLNAQLVEIQKLQQTSPDKFITASLQWAEDVAAIVAKLEPESAGARSIPVSQLMKTADFLRRKMRDPEGAIDVYKRAAVLAAPDHGEAAAVGMNDRVADIYQYDLHDARRASQALVALRKVARGVAPSARAEHADWQRWKARWLDAEIEFLDTGRPYGGDVSIDDLRGFAQELFFGAGIETTNGVDVDGDFNIYDEAKALSSEERERLLNLPPSRSMFLRTWLIAARLTSPDDASRWLARNDRAGFLAACLAAMAASQEPSDSTGEASSSRNPFRVLARNADGEPTGFAILGRELARRRSGKVQN
jgi:hypothetical protein